MKTAKAEWNSGNFTLTHSVELTEEQAQVFLDKGLLWYMQRNREHDVVLGAFEKKGDKMVRKDKWSRGDVEFSQELASKLIVAYSEIPFGADGESIEVDSNVVEYTREGAALKYRDAKEIASRHESAGDLESWLKSKGYEGETHGPDGEFLPAMLAAVHKVWTAHLAAQRAGV